MSWGIVPVQGVALAVSLGSEELPIGSLVSIGEPCEAGFQVEVLSVAGWIHPEPAARVGDRGCAPAIPLTNEQAVALSDGNAFHAGDVLDTTAAARLGADDVSRLRFVAPALLEEVRRTRDTYVARFGPLGLYQVPWTDWGRVGLPLTWMDDAAVEAEQLREHLVTPAQRERAVVATGPAWAHFLGADPAGSDSWANPEALRTLITLAADWRTACPEAACLLQIGDFSYYNETDPDPLGHKDHEGDCVDIRLFRADGSRYEAWWNRPDDRDGATAYDRGRTLAFLKFAVERAPVREVFFNDPEVIRALPAVKPLRGHDDHMHVCFGA